MCDVCVHVGCLGMTHRVWVMWMWATVIHVQIGSERGAPAPPVSSYQVKSIIRERSILFLSFLLVLPSGLFFPPPTVLHVLGVLSLPLGILVPLPHTPSSHHPNGFMWKRKHEDEAWESLTASWWEREREKEGARNCRKSWGGCVGV